MIDSPDAQAFQDAFNGDKANNMPPEQPEAMPDDFDKRAVAEEAKVAPKQPTFKEAFAAARSAGDKVFEFNGKKYTTEMAKAKPAMKDMPPITKPQELTKGTEPASKPTNSMKSGTDIYADNFIKDGINKIKGKLNEKGSTQKTLPSGKPNLTAAQ